MSDTPLFDLTSVLVPRSETAHIPSIFPSHVTEARIAVIGDMPTEKDQKQFSLFSCPMGETLKSMLASCGIMPQATMFTTVLRHHKPGYYEHAKNFAWDAVDTQQLKAELDQFKPNLIVLLGDVPLWLTKRGESVSNWHGSLFRCETLGSPLFGNKCIATFDMADAMRNYEWMPLMRFDLQRAAQEATSPELNLPKRTYELHLSPHQICDRLRNLTPNSPIAVDIEGYVSWISCIAIATSPEHAFIIPFGHFSPTDDAMVIDCLRESMARQDIPKILQNCIYDYFVLAYRYHIRLENIIIDTMLSGWELYPELPKGLGTQTALWTREPYYKFQRKVDNTIIHWRYCCTDACVTYEIAMRHMDVMTPQAKAHFNFNMELLPAINYMQLRGIAYDQERANELAATTSLRQSEIQTRINTQAGYAINVNSPKALAKLLYTEKRFPKQHPKKAGKIDRTKVTTNIDALLEINRIHNSPLIRDLIAWRKCEKLLQTLAMPRSPRDGRMRCSYNLVGTETGRLNCYSSAEQSDVIGRDKQLKDVGANLTTVTKKLRHLFKADDEFDFFQLDLAGADGWTVAAHCARFGDRAMLDDYLYGIKPARVIAYLFEHGLEGLKLPREELYVASKYIGNEHDPRNTPQTDTLYFICKRVQHGTNYLLGGQTMADQILKDSFKFTGNPIYVEPKTCLALQKLYLLRYKGVKAWQTWVENELRTKGRLNCASGHIRTFFGRRAAHETIRSAVAHEPQANTTFALNSALRRLWKDPENRRSDGSLIIEPLHHVHDAMCGQWPKHQRSWAIPKLKSYFENPLIIAGTQLTIPFEGGYGPSWGECKNPI